MGVRTTLKAWQENMTTPGTWWRDEERPWQPDPHRDRRHKELLRSALALVIGLPLLGVLAYLIDTAVDGSLFTWTPGRAWLVAVIAFLVLAGVLTVVRDRINKGK